MSGLVFLDWKEQIKETSKQRNKSSHICLQLDFKLYSLGFICKVWNHDIPLVYKHVHIKLWLVM